MGADVLELDERRQAVERRCARLVVTIPAALTPRAALLDVAEFFAPPPALAPLAVSVVTLAVPAARLTPVAVGTRAHPTIRVRLGHCLRKAQTNTQQQGGSGPRGSEGGGGVPERRGGLRAQRERMRRVRQARTERSKGAHLGALERPTLTGGFVNSAGETEAVKESPTP